jgi:hypothetical protein
VVVNNGRSFVLIVLPNGQKECLITNLPANKFPPETLKKLYCIRWKIETSFRLIKYSANLLEFHSKKIEFLQQEIWAKMIFYNYVADGTIAGGMLPKLHNALAAVDEGVKQVIITLSNAIDGKHGTIIKQC